MKCKHIEAFREVRLWIAQVIIPVGIAIAYFQTSEEAKEKVHETGTKMKEKLKEAVNRW